jgi:hypothetical protein
MPQMGKLAFERVAGLDLLTINLGSGTEFTLPYKDAQLKDPELKPIVQVNGEDWNNLLSTAKGHGHTDAQVREALQEVVDKIIAERQSAEGSSKIK